MKNKTETPDQMLYTDVRITEYSVRRVHEKCSKNRDLYELQIKFERTNEPSRHQYVGLFNTKPDNISTVEKFASLLTDITVISSRRFEVHIISKDHGNYVQLVSVDDLSQYTDLHTSVWEIYELPRHTVAHTRLCDIKNNE